MASFPHQAKFGTGTLTFIPSGATPTPVKLAVLRDVTIKASRELAPLEGEYEFPIDYAVKSKKFDITYKSAEIRADAVKHFVGGTEAAGTVYGVDNEVATIPTSPYAITVTQSATFDLDLGVTNLSTGKQMERVAATPATGQYSVTTGGVYTFASADAGVQVSFRYSYTSASAGKTLTVTNQLTGLATGVQALFLGPSGQFGWKFPNSFPGDLDMTFKNKDWTEGGGSLSVAPDASGNVAYLYRP